MKKFELKDEELNLVSGGILSDEAEEWVTRNRATVISRAGALGFLADYALNAVRKDEKVYDVDALKAAINGYGVNVDDLD